MRAAGARGACVWGSAAGRGGGTNPICRRKASISNAPDAPVCMASARSLPISGAGSSNEFERGSVPSAPRMRCSWSLTESPLRPLAPLTSGQPRCYCQPRRHASVRLAASSVRRSLGAPSMRLAPRGSAVRKRTLDIAAVFGSRRWRRRPRFYESRQTVKGGIARSKDRRVVSRHENLALACHRARHWIRLRDHRLRHLYERR